MSLDVIVTDQPYVIPAVPERICNVVVIPSLNLQHRIDDGQMLLALTMEVYKAGFDQYGAVLAPVPMARFHEPDMYGLAETDPFAENLMNAATAYARDRLEKLAQQQEQQESPNEQQGGEGTSQE